MPWMEKNTMSLRNEFVRFALAPGSNVRELCRRHQISPTTGYKWMARFREMGEEGLLDRPRRPRSSPWTTPKSVEEKVLAVREKHPAWGGRKLRRWLLNLGTRELPSASTITEILRRHGRLAPEESAKRKAFKSFERQRPNELWQMDFKGHFGMEKGRCHPLTVLDDHSRFALGLRACGNETCATVRECLTGIFQIYGLPECMLADNGSPWSPGGPDRSRGGHTGLTVWLLRLGVRMIHGRPWHPQTQGKDERFHRSLKAEVLRRESFRDLAHCQDRFDGWRRVYNHERPHEALSLDVPINRYRPSPRPYPQTLAPVEYPSGVETRKVMKDGHISYRGRTYRISEAFGGHRVALAPTSVDGLVDIVFIRHKVARIDLRTQREKVDNESSHEEGS